MVDMIRVAESVCGYDHACLQGMTSNVKKIQTEGARDTALL